MSTFIGQLVGFGLIVWLGWRYIVPLIRRMMANQQQSVRNQLDESAAAAERLAKADRAHAKAVEDAKAEAERVKAESETDAKRIVEQMNAQAGTEAERAKRHGDQQLELLRGQLIRELRAGFGDQAVRRAGDLVRDHVGDQARQSATVDRLLDELDAMAPSEAEVEYPTLAKMRSASRESLKALIGRFEDIAGRLDDQGLSQLADELVSVAKVFGRESAVTRALTAAAEDATPRVRLIERLVADKVGDAALEVLNTAVSQRWAAERDLVDAVEVVARQALLTRAERAGQTGEVEDQLFRFSRVLDAQPRLDALLSDAAAPAEGRVRLLHGVLNKEGSGANPVVTALLSQTIELLSGEPAQQAVLDLVASTVARRGEIVAQVGAAAELTDAQRTGLTQVLGRIYGHPASVQMKIDPALLGGLSIAVGDEVIDGTLAARLAAAQTQLPD